MQSTVLGAPDDPGVYALYAGDELLYVGVADGAGHGASICSALLQHLHGAREPRSATHYTWEITRDPLGRRAQLLHQLASPPRFNDDQPGSG